MSLSLQDYRSDVGIDKWIAEVGVTDAPLPRRNIRIALSFFSQAMASLPSSMAAHFLRAMDLSKPVVDTVLTRADRIIAFRTGNESPYKLFYARSGASAFSSGINPAGRSVVRFEVRTTARALETHTSGTLDVWTLPASDQPRFTSVRQLSRGVMVAGGGTQLIIPRAHSLLQATG